MMAQIMIGMSHIIAKDNIMADENMSKRYILIGSMDDGKHGDREREK